MPTWRPTLLLTLALGLALAAEVRVGGEARPVTVSTVRRVDVSYHLLTARSPLEFEVQGPAWLRVYTRLWWPGTTAGRLKYRFSLWQGEVERPVEFEAGVSSSSYGPQGHRLGEWRSFFVQVPDGRVRYRLVSGEREAETVAVRFAFQSPRPWRSLAIAGARTLVVADGRDTSRLSELVTGQAATVEVNGPCRIRVRVRLNFEPSLQGVQNFVVTASEGKIQLGRMNMKAARSASAVYVNEPGYVPSTERSLRFNLPAGQHRLTVALSGTLAGSGSVVVETLAGEKYE